MEWQQNFWAEYGALITGVLSAAFWGGLGVFLGRFAGTAAANKLTKKLDEDRLANKITDKVTEKVSRNLTGSVIDVDISAFVDKKLEQTLGGVVAEMNEVKNAVVSMKECSALTAKAVGKSRLLDKAEQAALIAEAEKLSEQVVREQKTVTKVKLETRDKRAPEQKNDHIMAL